MRVVQTVGIGLVLIALSLLIPGARETQAAQIDVDAIDIEYDPDPITINAGDTVEWTFAGADHTVTSGNGAPEMFDSGIKSAGQTYSRVFNTTGTYIYYCAIHGSPTGGGMAGTITVQAAATATTTATGQATATRTATRTPTRTPSPTTTGTVVATATPSATNTPATIGTPPTQPPTVPPVVDPGSPGGGSGAGGVTPPETGAGADATAPVMQLWAAMTLAAVGLVMVAGGAVVKRRG